jgi:hypothetical protein
MLILSCRNSSAFLSARGHGKQGTNVTADSEGENRPKKQKPRKARFATHRMVFA